MNANVALSRLAYRALYYCAGARWQSLKKLSLLLEEVHHKSKRGQIALAIYTRAQRRLDRTVERITLPSHLIEAELDIEIGFQHLTYAEHWLLLGSDRRAQHHSQKFVECLLAAVHRSSKPISLEERQLIDGQGRSFICRLKSQLQFERAIRNGDLSKQLTFVLGMHRSGTSALAGLLCQGGFDAPADLMRPTADNPKGYWESFGLCGINEDFLGRLGTSWHCIDALPIGWGDLPETSLWRNQVLSHLKKVFSHAQYPLIKDPRFCNLLPGLTPWLESDVANFCFLLPVRHPIEVARSLEIRGGVSGSQGIHSWLRHVFSSERASRGYPRYIVDFEKLLSDPQEVLARCKAAVSQRDAGSTKDFSVSVDQDLRHQRLHTARLEMTSTLNRMGAERLIASQLYELLAFHDKLDTRIENVVDELYLQWQTL
jgi:hypothetical protein